MKVKLLASLAGPERYHDAQPGEEWECDEAEAGRLIERGLAEPIELKRTTKEAAVSGPTENAMQPKANTKRQPSDGPSPKDSEPLETSN